ncbi:unnamed protein product [Clonostachys rosea]|uniref:Uncharacterized protein n=1 Tax=Bionectria ochroleuca TaxID=29856 RepID=A0ABY6U4W7_BIOOC|nr:unnamed protein product [Clonostachys rosea]
MESSVCERGHAGETGRDIAQDSGSGVSCAENLPSRNVSIPALHDDILYEIFSHYQPSQWEQHRDSEFEKERRQAIQNSRLYLIDELAVHIDEQSLAHATKVLEAPLISQGIRSIKVVLAYRPKEMADDISQYIILKMEELREIERDISGKLDEFTSAREIGERVPQQLVGLYGEAVRNYHLIRRACGDILVDEEDGTEQGSGVPYYEDDDNYIDLEQKAQYLAYRRILLEAYEQYAARHREQYLLVEDASFARVLASSVARLKSSIAISFVDEDIQSTSRENKAPALVDKTQLSKLLLAPTDWGAIWEVHRDALIHTVKVLTDLPIALLSEGIAVKQLELFCFPISSDFPRLEPSVGSWEDLEKALAHLKLFRLEGPSTNHIAVSRWFIREAAKSSTLFRYISAALISSALESVQFNSYCTNALPLYSVFQGTRWPRINHLSVRNIFLNVGDILDLSHGIASAGTIRTIRLENLQLRGEGFTPRDSFKAAVNTLHEVAVRHKCRVKFKGDPSVSDSFDMELQAAVDMYLSADSEGRNPLDDDSQT